MKFNYLFVKNTFGRIINSRDKQQEQKEIYDQGEQNESIQDNQFYRDKEEKNIEMKILICVKGMSSRDR